MKTIELLKPLPIRRDEQRHQYVNIETGQWFSYSTTQVCNELTEEDKQNIEFHRAEWQPRGEKVHECLAEKMLGNKKIDFKEYGSWVEPLLQHDLFTHFEPMAVEHMMAIPRKAVIISCEKERKMGCYISRIWIGTGKNHTQLINSLVVMLKC